MRPLVGSMINTMPVAARTRGSNSRQDRGAGGNRLAVGGAARYAAGWLLSTAAVVLLLIVALPDESQQPPALDAAARHAACRIVSGAADDGGGGLNAALRSGKVVVRYRATLGAAGRARLQDIVRRLAGRAVAAADYRVRAAAVTAVDGEHRLGCPRLDDRAEDALVLFVLSASEAR